MSRQRRRFLLRTALAIFLVGLRLAVGLDGMRPWLLAHRTVAVLLLLLVAYLVRQELEP